MIFLFQYKPATCEDKADNGDIVSVHYTVCTYMTFMLSASYLKALQWIPKERMFSHPYIFQARNLNQNCFNHLGANMLSVNRIWHPLSLAFCYHFKLDCLNKKTKINRQNKKLKKKPTTAQSKQQQKVKTCSQFLLKMWLSQMFEFP